MASEAASRDSRRDTYSENKEIIRQLIKQESSDDHGHINMSDIPAADPGTIATTGGSGNAQTTLFSPATRTSSGASSSSHLPLISPAARTFSGASSSSQPVPSSTISDPVMSSTNTPLVPTDYVAPSRPHRPRGPSIPNTSNTKPPPSFTSSRAQQGAQQSPTESSFTQVAMTGPMGQNSGAPYVPPVQGYTPGYDYTPHPGASGPYPYAQSYSQSPNYTYPSGQYMQPPPRTSSGLASQQGQGCGSHRRDSVSSAQPPQGIIPVNASQIPGTLNVIRESTACGQGEVHYQVGDRTYEVIGRISSRDIPAGSGTFEVSSTFGTITLHFRRD